MTPLPDFPLELAVWAVATGIGSAVAFYKIKRLELADKYRFALQEEEVEQLDLLTAAEAVERRNAIMEEVATRNASWLKQAAEEMARMESGIQDTGEGFKSRLLERGVKPPAHANAWGSLFMTLTRRKLLVPTGEYRPMLAPSSHGRKTAVYLLQKSEAA